MATKVIDLQQQAQNDSLVNVDEFIANLSDKELMERFDIAFDDCNKAGQEQPNTEWHESCFAATVILGQEMQKRGLRRRETN